MELLKSWKRNFGVGTDQEISQFAFRIGDFNPLHHNVEFALNAGLAGPIAPGVLCVEHTSAAIGNRIPGVMVRRITMEFKKPLYAGSAPSLVCEVVRQRRISADVNVTITNGFDLVAVGSCELLLPR